MGPTIRVFLAVNGNLLGACGLATDEPVFLFKGRYQNE
jgi:hypothetical protein